MFLLCRTPDRSLPEVFYCAKKLSSLRRYCNNLDVPLGGFRYEVYDCYGFFVGIFTRSHPFFNSIFTKSPYYGSNKIAPALWIALKAPEMGARCLNLLNSVYSDFAKSDFVRIYAADRH